MISNTSFSPTATTTNNNIIKYEKFFTIGLLDAVSYRYVSVYVREHVCVCVCVCVILLLHYIEGN